jgi:hypothetical protein
MERAEIGFFRKSPISLWKNTRLPSSFPQNHFFAFFAPLR